MIKELAKVRSARAPSYTVESVEMPKQLQGRMSESRVPPAPVALSRPTAFSCTIPRHISQEVISRISTQSTKQILEVYKSIE